MSFPFVRQYDAMDCGPACLSMIAAWYGKNISLETIRKKSFLTREGVSFLGLKEAASSLSMRAIGVRITFSRLREQSPLPCIVHWKQNHFIIVYRIRKNHVWVADPAIGCFRMSLGEFFKGWCGGDGPGEKSGLALLLEPGEGFSAIADDHPDKSAFSFFAGYLTPFRKTIVWLLAGLLAGSVIQLVLPFMTQLIIDQGIRDKDIHFIYLILFGQLALIAGRLIIEFTRGWLLLHFGSNVSINIVSGFLDKLMRLPVAFFETKMNGDIMQRIDDNARIESYLTSSSLALLFSLFSIVVFSVVLAFYSLPVVAVFLSGTVLYVLYLLLFMPSRERLDNERFIKMSAINGKMINMVNGMQEIKIAGNGESNRKEWMSLQKDLFITRVRSLKLSQFQTAGGTLIHESTNLIITIISATSVIEGSMTLGMMLAVQFITGQLSGPVAQMVNFLRATQDAKISLERLSEIHRMEGEDSDDINRTQTLPGDLTLNIDNVSFQYEGPDSPWVLKEVAFKVPPGKITAIVGESGSGKTTLLKLLMGFYRPVSGTIMLGKTNIEDISIRILRQATGVVMQEGYIFPETITGNIAPGEESPLKEKLEYAIRVSNLAPLLKTLPLGLATKVGPGGHGLSQGQKQRILIARAVYKNPSILILDEATSSLDATNEKMIVENLSEFFNGRTVVVVAHRLSTVRNADNIIVLDGGVVAESGTHDSLVEKRGCYFRLIQNQLELGN